MDMKLAKNGVKSLKKPVYLSVYPFKIVLVLNFIFNLGVWQENVF